MAQNIHLEKKEIGLLREIGQKLLPFTDNISAKWFDSYISTVPKLYISKKEIKEIAEEETRLLFGKLASGQRDDYLKHLSGLAKDFDQRGFPFEELAIFIHYLEEAYIPHIIDQFGERSFEAIMSLDHFIHNAFAILSYTYFNHLREAGRGLSVLAEVANLGLRDLPLNALLEQIAAKMVFVMGAHAAAIYIAQNGNLHLEARAGSDTELMISSAKWGEGLIGHTAEVMAIDTAVGPRNDVYRREIGVKSAVTVPLFIGEKLFGIGYLDYLTEHSFEPQEMQFYNVISETTSFAIQNNKLKTALMTQIDRFRILSMESLNINRASTFNQVMKAISQAHKSLFNYDRFAIYLFDQKNKLYSPFYDGLSPDYIKAITTRAQLVESFSAVLAHGGQVTSEDILKDHRYQALADIIIKEGFRSLLITPYVHSGKVIGGNVLYFDSPRRYNKSQLNLARALANQSSVALENMRLFEQQKHIATKLQKSLLPLKPPSISGFDQGVEYESATVEAAVGGDFYDIIELDDDKFVIVVGDVAGKGIDAAAETAMAKYSVRSFILENNNDASSVVKRLNKVVSRQLYPGKFITLILCLFDAKNGSAELVNAGHPYPLYFSKGRINYLEKSSSALGVLEDETYESQKFKFTSGDTLVFYTDGLVETKRNKEMFEQERLERSFRASKDKPAAGIARGIADSAKKFSEGILADDMLIYVVKKV